MHSLKSIPLLVASISIGLALYAGIIYLTNSHSGVYVEPEFDVVSIIMGFIVLNSSLYQPKER